MSVCRGHGLFLRDKSTVVCNGLSVHTAHDLLRRCYGWPRKLKPGPQQAVHAAALSLSGQPRADELPHVQQCAEKCREKHHFRENEPKHSQDIALVELTAIHPREIFADGSAEPAGQREDKKDQPRGQHPHRVAGTLVVSIGHVIEHQRGAKD